MSFLQHYHGIVHLQVQYVTHNPTNSLRCINHCHRAIEPFFRIFASYLGQQHFMGKHTSRTHCHIEGERVDRGGEMELTDMGHLMKMRSARQNAKTFAVAAPVMRLSRLKCSWLNEKSEEILWGIKTIFMSMSFPHYGRLNTPMLFWT